MIGKPQKDKKRIARQYTKKQLELIAQTLNILSIKSEKTLVDLGNFINTNHFTRFHSINHYIDYNDRKGLFKVYKKFKGWQPNDEMPCDRWVWGELVMDRLTKNEH